ncbi:hypothetical protein M427DRAFT_334130 [Gonapodya prolifera JEL478]|uniref:Uncharacterized protein n=1 Tax=Gonapodya prolifera (strain JEL478) TaxID=1344416 RepID=A0A138ZW87_GONPJ|nr:hypothetical protein M427DRAFT_334130 [Gonapodya prolifera JEL478]|eukprot:KXS08762.1 hypothetical protein M427DRAFT_334130 [Gonapodya prolifera JEL478]
MQTQTLLTSHAARAFTRSPKPATAPTCSCGSSHQFPTLSTTTLKSLSRPPRPPACSTSRPTKPAPTTPTRPGTSSTALPPATTQIAGPRPPSPSLWPAPPRPREDPPPQTEQRPPEAPPLDPASPAQPLVLATSRLREVPSRPWLPFSSLCCRSDGCVLKGRVGELERGKVRHVRSRTLVAR